MQHDGYYYRVECMLTLTGAELKKLMDSSRHHYDGVCKAASNLGGFLYGTANRFIFHNELYPTINGPSEYAKFPDDKTVPATFTTYEMQTICKISELDRDRDLHKSLMEVLRSCIEHTDLANNPSEAIIEDS